MESEQQKKLKGVCHHLAFLMEHQHILPDLKEIVAEMNPQDEYSKGAQDALNYLIGFLERKGI